MAEQMWGGRFAKSTDEMINEFQASINFDKRMYHEDIAGSIAHAKMLNKVGILNDEDTNAIITGLKNILIKIEQGNFDFSVDLEDIHRHSYEYRKTPYRSHWRCWWKTSHSKKP